MHAVLSALNRRLQKARIPDVHCTLIGSRAMGLRRTTPYDVLITAERSRWPDVVSALALSEQTPVTDDTVCCVSALCRYPVHIWMSTPHSSFTSQSLALVDHMRRNPLARLHHRQFLQSLPDQRCESRMLRTAYFMAMSQTVELGQRFPIELTPYDPHWAVRFHAERAELVAALGDLVADWEHIGSTSVPGLSAKPVIDLVGAIESFEVGDRAVMPVLQCLGYLYQWQQHPEHGHMAFWKGYQDNAAVKVHIHLAPANHPLHERRQFCRYLRTHPAVARRYESLKHRLARLSPTDREAYTRAKGPFILYVTRLACKSRTP